ncbi:SDR family oxidoreductase [Streptomyces sp. NPDC001700]
MGQLREPFQLGAPGADYDHVAAVNLRAVFAATQEALRHIGDGGRGITVNTVQPGPVDTDMNPADGPWAADGLPHLAVGRYGTADEVAGLVTYLAGPDAAYVTGATLDVDGGYTA